MSAVQYARPRSLQDATRLLANLGAGASVIAGGQELMPAMNYRVFAPTVLIDINGLKELKGIERDGDMLSIGALCVHRDITRDPLVLEHAPLLAHALGQVGGGWQVRNRGTIGGNIVSMHSLYDTLPALLTLGASLTVAAADGMRTVRLSDLLKDSTHGLGTTTLLTRVSVPIPPASAGWGYDKLKNTHGAYAAATAAAVVVVDDTDAVTSIALAIGSAEPLPRDVSALLAGLTGRPGDDDFLAEVERIAAGAVSDPISDQRGAADYRRAMAGVSARRAVGQALRTASRQRIAYGATR